MHVSNDSTVEVRGKRRRFGCLAGCLATFVACLALAALAAGLVVRHQRQEAQRVSCLGRLKYLGVATHFYHDVNGQFPSGRPRPGTTDVPMSWRVEMLPYLERGELYDRYDRSQSWDSPANRPVALSMPEAYACPADPFALETNRTSYFAVEADGAIRDPDEDVDFGEVTDGLSNTLLYVESSQHDVPWVAPQDIPAADLVAPQGAGAVNLRGRHGGSANVVYADSSYRQISPTIDPKVLRALISRAGGESVSPP